MSGEVTTGQTLDPETEFAESLLREVDLPVFKRIFIAAAHQEREPIAISIEEAAEIEPVALRLVISDKACCSCEVEQAIVAVHGAVELAEFRVCYMIALGPHLPYSWHPLEEPEGTAHASAGSVGEAAQHGRGVPGMGVPIREEPAIEDENAAYFGPAGGFTAASALKPTSQVLENDKRGKVEGNQRCGLHRQMPPDRFDKIGTLRGRIRIVFRLVAVTHANVLDEKLGHLGGVRQVRENPGPSK